MIRIAVTNLGKYNEGELIYKWLELPYDHDDLKSTLQEIGINEEYEEYFISDYEAPFEINEYASIGKLNEFVEEISNYAGYDEIVGGNYDYHDITNFANSAGKEEYVDDLVDDETLDFMVKGIIENDGGWLRVKFFLGGIDDITDDIYRINGYGNAENVTSDYLDIVLGDILNDLRGGI